MKRKCCPHHWPFYFRNHPHKATSIHKLDTFSVVSPNKLFHRQENCHWYQTHWRPSDVTITKNSFGQSGLFYQHSMNTSSEPQDRRTTQSLSPNLYAWVVTEFVCIHRSPQNFKGCLTKTLNGRHVQFQFLYKLHTSFITRMDVCTTLQRQDLSGKKANTC